MPKTQITPDTPEPQSADGRSNSSYGPLPKDLLDRAAEVETLNKLLFGDAVQRDESTPGETIAVCGGWGTGKTWLVKKWREHLLRNAQARVVYMSAWKCDYGDDPIVSLLHQIQQDLSGDKTVARKLITWVKKHKVFLFSLFFKTLGAKEIARAVEKEIQKREDGLKELGKLLEDISTPAPLVVFVDELDRCRPLHAIAMLERIKHVFQEAGITFVLSIDKINLKQSIKSVYGEIDADDYLRRFFEIEYHLPQKSGPQFATSLFHQEQVQVSDVVPTLLMANDLSLRSMQRVVTGIKLVMNSELLRDVFTALDEGKHLETAQSLYDKRDKLGAKHPNEVSGSSALQREYIAGWVVDDPTKGDCFEEFFQYQDHTSDLALFIRDFAYGIVTWNLLSKLGVEWHSSNSEGSFRRAAQEQTSSWGRENACAVDDQQQLLNSKRRNACGDEYYTDMLAWSCYMSMYCAQMIEKNRSSWLKEGNTEHVLVEQIYLRARYEFIERSGQIRLSTRAGEITQSRLQQSFIYQGEPRLLISGIEQAKTELSNMRQDIACKALVAASVASAKVCNVVASNPGILGVITGNRTGE